MYTTLSPCAMCSGAILLYGIPRVVVGEHETLASREWTTSLVESGLAGTGAHVVMPGLPHSSPHADPEAFARLVLELTPR